ncbi:MAG: DnaA ATPase domain-containing protein [Planctomycetaceae bacterium]
MQPGCLTLAAARSAQGKSLREALEAKIGERQFEHWFQARTQLVIEHDTLVVQAPSPFLTQWLQKQFRGALAATAHELIGPAARLRFEVSAAPLLDTAPLAQSAGTSATGPIDAHAALRDERETAGAEFAAKAVHKPGRRFGDLAELVTGSCNEMALTAVRQLCDRPLEACGPLYVYGPVGTGKSHLLEGAYRELRRRHPHLSVLFISSEQFTNYFTQAYREHTLPAFRQRFRNVDVLLVDDVEFLDAKRVIQEEFLHTIRHLESRSRLFLACGDRHPRLITKISDDLRTRLLAGMLCRLELPALETRLKIVAHRAERLNAEFTPEALRYVAERFNGGVRELEGALHSLQVYYHLTTKRVGVTAARQVLADLERDCLRIVKLADVDRVVCDLFGLSPDELRSPSRSRAVSEPRMLAMYLARRHTRAAYSEIGQHFGGRNHATVIAAERKVAALLTGDGSSIRVGPRPWRVTDLLQTLEQQLLAG